MSGEMIYSIFQQDDEHLEHDNSAIIVYNCCLCSSAVTSAIPFHVMTGSD